MRRSFAIIGLVVVLLAAGYLGAGVFVYQRLTTIASTCEADFGTNTPARFAVEPLEGTPAIDASAYAMPEFRNVSFPARDDGLTIRAWYVPPAADGGPVVVLVHGLGGCRHEGRVLLAAGMLHHAGIGALAIDLRNHGESDRDDGRYGAGVKEYRDVLGAWDWLVAQGEPPERIGLWGESLGAATAMIAMGEERRVAATWEDSGYADLEEAIQAELARNGYPTFLEPAGILAARVLGGVDLTSRSPLEAVAKLDGRPVFITHGTADTRLSVSYATELADAIRATGEGVDPWIVPGAGHVEAILRQPAEYERRLDGFFGTALAATPAGG